MHVPNIAWIVSSKGRSSKDFRGGFIRRLDHATMKTMRYSRITVEPDKMGGVPCIRGLRIPVATVVALVADGMSREEILKEYPLLEPEDIEEALRYAAQTVR